MASTRKRTWLVSLAIVVIAICLAGLNVTQYRIPVTESELLGTWIRSSDDSISCITLNDDGTFSATNLPSEVLRRDVLTTDAIEASGTWSSSGQSASDQYALVILTVNGRSMFVDGERYTQQLPLHSEWFGPFRTLGYFIGDPDISKYDIKYSKSGDST
jgi:hypothetical protein